MAPSARQGVELAAASSFAASDRFNLLLLEDGEYYFRDHACYYWREHRRQGAGCRAAVERRGNTWGEVGLFRPAWVQPPQRPPRWPSPQGGRPPEGVQPVALFCAPGHPGAGAQGAVQERERHRGVSGAWSWAGVLCGRRLWAVLVGGLQAFAARANCRGKTHWRRCLCGNHTVVESSLCMGGLRRLEDGSLSSGEGSFLVAATERVDMKAADVHRPYQRHKVRAEVGWA